MSRSHLIIAAAEAAVEEGQVLHVRAERKPGSRKEHTPALDPVDLTVGPHGRGGFMVVDYSRKRGGEEDRYETAHQAIRAVHRKLTADRTSALGAALVKLYGSSPPPDTSRLLDDWQRVREGSRLRVVAERGRPLRGPLFGPTGTGRPRGR
jgi:hypothetical protein